MNNGIEKIAEENAKPDNNVQERSLTAHETDKLVEYISLAAKRRQEYTKNKNWLIIHPHFLTPSSGMVNLPLDDPPFRISILFRLHKDIFRNFG